MDSFDGKLVFITGAASGIGRATAQRVAREGGKLLLTDVRAEDLRKVADEIGAPVLGTWAVDITDHGQVRAMADEIHAQHGSMDVVMNVAGISTWGTVDVLTNAHWRQQVEVNLMGPISVIEAFIPPMMAAKRGGHLVNVSSAAGLFGLPWHAPYSAAKFGLRGVSEVLRFDLERHRIGVSLCCPGAVDTPLVQSVNIVGVDRENPTMKKMNARFQRHARKPEQVAASIVNGVKRNRYLIFTSPDIHALYLTQRYIPPVYNLIMRIMNRQLTAVARKAKL